MTGVAAELHALAVEVGDIPRRTMIALARAGKEIARQEGARVAGADGMKGKKKRAMKLRARDDIRTVGTETTCRIQGVNPSAWVWANTGTAAHKIRRRKRGPMKVMTVQHPGTSGRRAWDTVETRIGKLFPEILDQLVDRAIDGH